MNSASCLGTTILIFLVCKYVTNVLSVCKEIRHQAVRVWHDCPTSLSPAEFMVQLFGGSKNMAAFGRELGVPTQAGIPHSFRNAFKNVAALVGETSFEVKELEEVKKFFADPEAYAAANPGGGGGGDAGPAAPAGGAPAKAAAAPVEEEEEEEMEFDLFG